MNPERNGRDNFIYYFKKIMIANIIEINLCDTGMPKEHFLSRTG